MKATIGVVAVYSQLQSEAMITLKVMITIFSADLARRLRDGEKREND